MASKRVNKLTSLVKGGLRRPRAVGSLALSLEDGNGSAVAHVLLRELPERERLIVASRIVPEVDLAATFERGGTRWTVDLSDDEIGRELVQFGAYEDAEVQALLSFMRERRPHSTFPVAVDLGANVGTTTVPLARSGYRVVAVEPVPRTFKMLQANVDENGFADRVLCVRKAIASTAERLEMWLTTGSGLSEVVTPGTEPAFTGSGFKPRGSINVEAVGLGQLLSETQIALADVAFVWSDTQGSEIEVITSGRELWRSGVPLYTEVWPRALASRGGLDELIGCVSDAFTGFIARDDLVRSGAKADVEAINDFAGFLSSIDSSDYSDALLIP